MSEEWHPIPIDENILSLARWAVVESGEQLEFRGVWSAKLWSLPGAIHYWIVLAAADGGVTNKYEAKVEVLSTDPPAKRLEEFKPILQA